MAIKGPRFDGHDFVADVLERGAAAAIVDGKADLKVGLYQTDGAPEIGRGRPSDRPTEARRGRPSGRPFAGGLIEVGDTVKALQDLAHAVRLASGTRVIAITGSAGKTTTKETIAAFLERRKTVVKNKGNLNNHIGLPLSLMQVRTAPDVAVMELGMNHAGEISTLVAIAEPDVRVWTNVGDAHLGFFASPDAIADAKAEILERATASTVLVCNADDPRVMTRARGFAGRTITFGVSEPADVRAVSVDDRGLSGVRARVTTPAGEVVLESPAARPRQSVERARRDGGGDRLWHRARRDRRSRDSSSTGRAPRSRARHSPNGVTVVDDSYNSSPAALATALDVIAERVRRDTEDRRAWRDAGAGRSRARLHAESGRLAAHSGISQLYAIGGARGSSAGRRSHRSRHAACSRDLVCLERRGRASHCRGP